MDSENAAEKSSILSFYHVHIKMIHADFLNSSTFKTKSYMVTIECEQDVDNYRGQEANFVYLAGFSQGMCITFMPSCVNRLP